MSEPGSAARFSKRGPRHYAAIFAAEAEGLAALRAAGVRAPEPYAHGLRGNEAYLEMERLELGGVADWPGLARMLARLHRNLGERFGWPSDNFIGPTPQPNRPTGDWIEFWATRRLAPQFALAAKSGYEALAAPGARLIERLPALLGGHAPQPSLLHGDLWNGNAGFLKNAGPVLFDPAVYYGDREADLAMTELFGGFPRAFYEAYHEAWPLERGYQSRRTLYNLYHLLNHLNLFGSGYLGQVRAALRLLLDAL